MKFYSSLGYTLTPNKKRRIDPSFFIYKIDLCLLPCRKWSLSERMWFRNSVTSDQSQQRCAEASPELCFVFVGC